MTTIAEMTPARYSARANRPRYFATIRQQSTRVIKALTDGQIVRIEQRPSYRVEVNGVPTQVVVGGVQGPRGAPGVGFVEVAFRYGDATPKPIVSIAADSFLKLARVYITEAFDGTGAALTLGDVDDPTRIMESGWIDPATLGETETAPGIRYDDPTQVLLFITPGAGATQGAGVVVLEV